MKNKEYTNAVNVGDYPNDPVVPLENPFIDERGVIQNLLTNNVNGVAVITSKAGSVRSNHFHKEDWHYLYVVSGRVLYEERDLGQSSDQGKSVEVTSGQMFFTPPMVVHKVTFLEDTVLLSLSKRSRDHDSHESDVVREEY